MPGNAPPEWKHGRPLTAEGINWPGETQGGRQTGSYDRFSISAPLGCDLRVVQEPIERVIQDGRNESMTSFVRMG